MGDVAALPNFKDVMVIGTTLHLKSLLSLTGCGACILPVALFLVFIFCFVFRDILQKQAGLF